MTTKFIIRGDNIYTECDYAVESCVIEEKNNNEIKIYLEDEDTDSQEKKYEGKLFEIDQEKDAALLTEIVKDSIEVFVNDNSIKLKDKASYVFVDIFNYVQFDLSTSKGELVLLLNENKAGFYDKLKNGDRIEIKWK